jgi:hypothetical protein
MSALVALAQIPQNVVVNNSAFLISVLNLLFLSAVPFVVAYISFRSFSTSGSYTLLFLGAGLFTFGLLGAMATPLITLIGTNANVSVLNSGIFLSGVSVLFASVSAVTAPSKQVGSNHRGLALGLSLLISVILGGVIALAVLNGVMPAFYLQGVGFTALRQAVMLMATVVLALSCFLFMIIYSRTRVISASYWFSLGVGLCALSTFAATAVTVYGNLLQWVVRGGLYLGMLYLLAAVATTFRSAEHENKGSFLIAAVRKPEQRKINERRKSAV